MSKGNWLRRRVKAISLRIPFSSSQGDDSSFTSTSSYTQLRASDSPWFVFSILQLVFEYLQPETPEGRAACASASRACRSFSDPASIVLWRQLPSLFPLWNAFCHFSFRLSPRDSLETRCETLASEILRSRCYESPGVAQYILSYANRVRLITDVRLTSAEQNLISVLANFAAYSPLLPLLSTMQLSFDAPGAPTLCLVASPILERLQVRIDKRHFNSQDLSMALDILSVRAPSLRSLAISMIPDDRARFISAILHFPKLESIKVDQPITSSTLELLGTVKSIHTMSIVAAGHGDWIDAVVDTSTLRTLLCTGSSKALGALTTALRAPALSTLDMTTRVPSDVIADYASLVQTVGASIASGTVRTLSLTMHPRDPSRVQTRSATPISTFLRPWLALPQLERVSFVLGCYSTITAEDTDFRTFADAWSGLERLTVRGCATIRRRGPSGDLCPSRETAGYLARRCPQLASLELNGVFARIERGAS